VTIAVHGHSTIPGDLGEVASSSTPEPGKRLALADEIGKPC
jgi:hypothetical protein